MLLMTHLRLRPALDDDLKQIIYYLPFS